MFENFKTIQINPDDVVEAQNNPRSASKRVQDKYRSILATSKTCRCLTQIPPKCGRTSAPNQVQRSKGAYIESSGLVPEKGGRSPLLRETESHFSTVSQFQIPSSRFTYYAHRELRPCAGEGGRSPLPREAEFRIQDSRFRINDAGFKIQDSGRCEILKCDKVSTFKMQDSRFNISKFRKPNKTPPGSAVGHFQYSIFQYSIHNKRFIIASI